MFALYRETSHAIYARLVVYIVEYRKVDYMVVYTYGKYAVVPDGSGYKIFNVDSHDQNHTHGVKSLRMCKTIVHNVVDHRKPKTRNGYLLQSHLRLTNSKKYAAMINQLIDNKKNRQFYNDKHVYRACR